MNGNATSVTRTLDKAVKSFYIYIGANADVGSSFTFTEPMLNIGELTQYQPYFSDLKRANIKAIKSTGRNLFNSNILLAAEGWTVDANGVYSGDLETFYKKFKWDMGGILTINNGVDEVITVSFIGKTATKISSVCVNFAYADGTYSLSDEIKYLNSAEFTKYVVSSKTGRGGVKYAYISFGSTDTLYLKDFCIKYGTGDVYEPYTEELYELPQELIKLYPNGIPEYDRFNPQTGELIRQTRRLRIDELTDDWRWSTLADSGENEYSYYFPAIPLDNASIQAVCNIYKSKSRDSMWRYTATAAVAASEGYLRFREPSVTTLDEFRAYAKSLADAGTPMIVDIKVNPTIEKIENAPKQYKSLKHGSETVIQGDTDNSIYGAMPTVTNEYFVAVGAEEGTNE